MKTNVRKRLVLLYHFFHPDDVISARLFTELGERAAAEGWEVIAMPSVRSCHDGDARLAKRESWRGIDIRRIWRPAWRQSSNAGRLLNTAFMLTGWTWQSLWLKRLGASRGGREVLVVGTDPIFGILATLPWRLFRPRTTIVHWCHDVHPEASLAEGTLKSTALHVRLLRWWMRRAYRRCDLIVDLGECMRRLLIEAGGWKPDLPNTAVQFPEREGTAVSLSSESRGDSAESNARYDADCLVRPNVRKQTPCFETITPWSLIEPDQPVESDTAVRQELFGDAALGLLYSGNLGRAHDYRMFVKLARMLREQDAMQAVSLSSIAVRSDREGVAKSGEERGVEPKSTGSSINFCFAGRGVGIDALTSELTDADDNIRLAGFATEEMLEKRLGAGDVHLVSLKDNWTGTVVPSKFFGALAIGRPVLFVGSRSAAIADWIEQYDVGWILNEHNLSEVACTLKQIAAGRSQLQDINIRCRQVYREHFSRKVQLEKWMDRLNHIQIGP